MRNKLALLVSAAIVAATDDVQCPNGHCTLDIAYVAWEGPQQQIEFVYGAY